MGSRHDSDEEESPSALSRVIAFVSAHVFTMLIALLALGLGWFLWLEASIPPLTQKQFEKVQDGMTEKEVEKVLGRPATTRKPTAPTAVDLGDDPVVWKEWDDGKATVLIAFSKGRVRYKHWGRPGQQ